MQRVLIIGGSDAGISAALRIKENYPQAGVTVVVADQYPNFSICGLPFYLSGEVQDWRTLAHRTAGDIEKEGIHLLLDHTANAIYPHKKQGGVLVAVGARPETNLAGTTCIKTGIKGAIKVDRRMRTNVPDIYAAGDCAETWHKILQEDLNDIDLSYTPPLSSPWDPVQMTAQAWCRNV